jgi:catechol 2,3-dioxygenase-like lactoylglutathione lyase family enzyme
MKGKTMHIEHIALNVSDPIKMAEWWVRHLGMRVVRRVEGATNTHFLADELGRTVLELYHQGKAPVPEYFGMDPMVLHVAFLAPNLPAERERLLAAGATSAADASTTPAGDVLAFLRDPWGVTVQLVQRARPLMYH